MDISLVDKHFWQTTSLKSCLLKLRLTSWLLIADAQCKSPDAIDNGSFSPRSSDPRPVGSVVRYKCNRGYAAVGDVLIRCQESGKWSAGAPRCEGNLSQNSFSSEPWNKQFARTFSLKF